MNKQLCQVVAILVVSYCWTATDAQYRNAETYTETRTTYDWGKHTGTDYDWGQHTGSTFDWGQYTSTQATNGGDDHQQDGHGGDQNQDQDGHMYQHRCGGGRYTCAGAPGLCLDIRRICDGVVNCPQGDDEDARYCPESKQNQNNPNTKPISATGALARQHKFARSNKFRGQGFMFAIKQVKVVGAQVKLFNQDSDRQIQQ